MATQFFGQRWDAPRVDDAMQVDIPVGEPCLHCGEPIEARDRGLMMSAVIEKDLAGDWIAKIYPVHLECDLRSTLSHIFQQCHCFVPDRSLRDEARATLDAINTQRATEGFGPM